MLATAIAVPVATVTGPAVSMAGTYFWDPSLSNSTAGGGTGLWDASTANWYDGSTGDVAWPNTLLDLAVFGGTAGAVSLGAPIQANGLTFNVNGYTIDNGGTAANTLTLGGTTPTITVTTAGDVATISAVLAGNTTLNTAGAGTLVLSGANTYTGLTTISSGVLNIQSASALGTVAAGTVVSSGAALQIQGGITTLAEGLTLNGTGILNDGALRNISGTNVYAGLLTLGSATRINSDAGLLTLSNTGTITGATFGLTVGGAGNTTIASIIGTTTGSLTKDGAGTLTLSGVNTFTGGLSINGGIVAFGGADTNLGAGGVTLNGGTLTYTGAAYTMSASRIFTVGASGGTLNLATNVKVTVGTAGQFTGSGTLTRMGTVGNQANNLSITAANTAFTGAWVFTGGVTEVSGTNSLGSGAATNTLTLSGGELANSNNTVAQNITINSGVLGGDNGTSIYSGAITVNGNFSVRLGDFYQSFSRNLSITGNLSGAGVISFLNGNTYTAADGTGQTLFLSGNNTGYTSAITATPGFNVAIGAANSFPSGGLIASSSATALGGVGFGYDFGSVLPGITNSRTGTTTGGVFGINTMLAATTTLDLNTLGGGGMFLGSQGAGIYAATTLGPDTTSNVYRLGGGGGTLTITQAVLQGNNALVVGDSRINGGGTVVLSGINSAFTGLTTINTAATLSVGADTNLGAVPGAVVANEITLAGGTLSANASFTLNSNRGITLSTGGGSLAAGSGSTLTYGGVIAGTTTFTKTGAGTVVLTGANAYNSPTVIAAGTLSVATINSVNGGPSPLGAPTSAANGTISLGTTTVAGLLAYTGTGGTTDRIINLLGTTGGGTIDQSGTGLLKFTSNFTATGAGIKTLTLQGSTAGTGEISGAIVNNTGTNITSVTKTGSGVWTLSGANTYTGVTTITGGSLFLTGTSTTSGLTYSAGTNSTLTVTNAAASGNGMILFNTGATTPRLNLHIDGSGSNGTITLGNGVGGNSSITSTIDVNNNGGTTTGNQIILNGIPSSGFGNANLNVTGGNGYSLRIASLSASGGSDGTVTLNPTTAALSVGALSASAAHAYVYALDGTNPANTVTGIISNGTATSVAVTKSNTGVWTLSGANTYTGATTVSGGVLNLTSSIASTSTLSVGAAGRFNYLPTTIGTTETFASGTLTAGATLGMNWNTTTASKIAATAAFTAPAGVVNLAPTGTFTSGTTYTVLGAASGLNTAGVSYLLLNPTNYTATVGVSATAVTITPTAATALTTAFWNGGLTGAPAVWSASSGSASNWTTDVAGTLATGVVPSAGTSVTFSSTAAVAANQTAITLGTSVAVAGITVTTANPLGISDVAPSRTLSIDAGGITVNSGAGVTTIAANLVATASETWANNSTNTLTFGATGTVATGGFTITLGGPGAIALASTVSGSGALSKTGAGNLTLSGTNTFTGTTTVSGGTLTLAADANLGTAPASVVANDLTLAGSTLATTATFTLNSNRGITLGAGGATISTASATTLTYGGVITGSTALTKTGAGTLILSGANNYLGGTAINAGVLQFNGIGAVPSTGTIAVSAAGTLAASNFTTADVATLLAATTPTSAGVFALVGTTAAADVNFTNFPNLFLGATSATTYTGTFTPSSTGTVNLGGGGGALTFNQNLLTPAVTNVNIGNGASAGTVILGGTNTYTGPTTINAGGTLSIAAAANLGASSNTLAFNGTTASAATLQVTGTAVNSLTTHAVTFASNGSVAFDVNAAANTFTLDRTANLGTGSLTKLGAGTLNLNNPVTLTGNVVASSGTLNLNSAISGSGTTTTLAYGGTAGTTIVNVANAASNITAFATAGANITGAVTIYNQSAGTVTISPGTADSQFVAKVGYGNFNLTGGTYRDTQRFDVNANSATAVGVASVSGTGTLNNTGGDWFIIAYNGLGELTVAPGGTITRVGATNPLGVALGSGAYGVLNVAGGTVDAGTQPIRVANSTSTATTSITGFIDLAAGTLSVGTQGVSSTFTGSSGNVYYTFTGGTLRANAALAAGYAPVSANGVTTTSTIYGAVNNAPAAGNATQNFVGGLVVDTNGFAVALPNVLNSAAGTTGVAQSSLAVMGGSGYVGAPAVQFLGGTLAAGGTPAAGYAVISGGAVTGIVITNPGSYTAAPTVTLSGGGGTGASVTVGTLATNTAGGLTKTGAAILTVDYTQFGTSLTSTPTNQIAAATPLTLSGGGLALLGRANGATTSASSWTGATTSPVLTFATLPTGLVVGQALTGTGIPVGAYVVSIDATNKKVTINANATAAAGTDLASTATVVTTSQTFAGTTLTPASVTIAAALNGGSGTLLNLGAIVRSVGSVVDFTLPTGTPSATNGITTTTANDANGILGAWATTGGGTLATNASGNIVAYTGYTDIAARGPSVIADGAASNVRINTPGTSGSVTLGAGTTTVNTLTQNTTTASTVDTTGGVLRVGSTGGILTTTGNQTLTIGTGSDVGALTAGGADNTAGELILGDYSTNTLTINSTITDNGTGGVVSLTKAGTGLVVLTGSNAYTGLTTVGAGTLQVGTGGTVGSLGTAATTVSSGGILLINRSDAYTYNSAVSGAGSLTKAAAGTTTLGGVLSYTGATTVTQGTLAFTADETQLSSSGLVLGTTAVAGASSTATTAVGSLDLATVPASATFASLATPDNSATANTISIGSGKTLTILGNVSLGVNLGASINVGNTATSNLSVSGAGSLVFAGGTTNIGVAQSTQLNTASQSTLDLTGLTGTFTATPTTFNIGFGQTAGGTVKLTNTANTIIASTLSVGDSNNSNGGGGTLTLGTGTNTIQADTITLGAGKTGGVLSFVSQTAGSPGTVTIANRTGVGGAAITVGSSNAGTGTFFAATLDLRGHIATVTASTVTVGNTAIANTGTASGTISFDTGTFDATALNLGQRSGTVTAGNPNTATLNVGGGAFTVAGATTFAASTAGGAYASNVTGTLNLTGGSFTTGTVVGASKSGAANTGAAIAAINVSAGILTVSGSTFSLATQSNTGTATGTLAITGSGAVITSADITDGGGTTTTTVSLNGATALLDLTGHAIGSATTPVDVVTLAAGTLRNVGEVNNGAGITKTTAGTLILDNTGLLTNTYSGGTTISAGTVQVGSGGTTGTLGAGTVAVGGNILAFNRSNAYTVSNLITGTSAGAVNQIGAGTTTLGGPNTYTGATTVTAGVLKAGVASVPNTSGAFGNNSAVTLTNVAASGIDITGFDTQVGSLTGGGSTGGNVTLGGATLTIAGANASPVTYAGAIAGTGMLVKSGSGTQTLTGTSSYLGNTIISGGTLAVNNDAALGSATNTVTILSGASLATVATFTSNTRGMLVDAGTGSTVNVAAGTTLTHGGTIANANPGGILNKSGSGTMILTASNTYTGATNINGGLLLANNATNSTGTGPVAINATGTLGGTGTVGGGITLTGSITAGSSSTDTTKAGTLATGAASWQAGGTYVWKINTATGSLASVGSSTPGAADQLQTGGLSFTGAAAGTYNLTILGSGVLPTSGQTPVYYEIALGAVTGIAPTDPLNFPNDVTNFFTISTPDLPPGVSASNFRVLRDDGMLNLSLQTGGTSVAGLDLVYTPTPEPVLTSILGLAALSLTRRPGRRRKAVEGMTTVA